MPKVLPATERFGTKAGRKLRLAVGESVHSRKVQNATLSWAAFVDRLRDPIRTKESYAAYMAASRERQDAIKDVGYYVPTNFERGERKKKRMESRDLVTLDADSAAPHALEELKKVYEGWSWVVHSTHKHCAEKPRLRLILPLTRAVTEDEYSAVSRKLADLADIDWFDDTTYQFSRVMHWPSVSYDADYVFRVGDGAWVDPDEVLSWYDDWTDVAQWPVSSRQSGALRKTAEKAEDPTAKRGVVGAFCRAYDVPSAIETYLEETYEPTDADDDRYTYRPGTTSNGAVVYDDGLFLYSNHGTDPCGGRLVNAFDLVRIHRFGDLDDSCREDMAVTSLPSFKAMADLAREDETVLAELSIDIATEFEDVIEATDDDDDLGLDGSSNGEQAEKPDHREWLKKLKRDKNDAVKANLHNLTLILHNDPVLKGSMALNQFSNDLVQRRDLPDWPLVDDENGDLWTDHNDIIIKYRLEIVYKLQASRALINEAVDLVAHENRWHPVREYLKALEWDGHPRVETLFLDYLGCPDTHYHRQIARKALTAAVTRVFHPGAKFDNVPILEGPQGTRKSTFVKHLFTGWFTDGLRNFDKTQEAVEVMKGKWGLEIAELHAFSKSEIEAAKAFISRETDRVREAYDKRAKDYPRQCVFWGTTNDGQYLKDPTGNRRYWPIKVLVDLVDTERLQREVHQIWAEAMTLYRAGESLDLDAQAKQEARVEQGRRVVTDDLAGLVEEWMDEPVPVGYLECEPGAEDFAGDALRQPRDRVCTIQVWCELLGGSPERFTRRESARIKQVLQSIPWLTESEHPVRFGRRYGRQRGFYRDEEENLGL